MKKNKNLPTLESSLGGGYLESKTKPRLEKRIITSIVSMLILVLIIGISYAYINYNTNQNSVNALGTNCIQVDLEDLTNGTVLTEAYPVEDAVGEKTNPYSFRISNKCGVGVDYTVNLAVLSESNLNAKNVATKIDTNSKVLLTETNKVENITIENESVLEAYKIYTGTLPAYESIEHNLRIWLDYSAGNDAQNKTFKTKVVVSALQNQIVSSYKEAILNGTDPVLDEEGKLIPVTISEENGKVTKADLDTAWYKYEDQKWANAVILKDTGKIEEDGTIKEDSIESYFVWIPRYRYKLFNTGNYPSLTAIDTNRTQQIEIEFETKDTNQSSGNQMGEWLTHPAFTAFNTNGIWVGKFETGYDETTTSEENSKVIIKPNVYSWRNITVKNAFDASYYYQRNLDSHMMKNTEWGAVAYLQHSKFGSKQSVRINNNSAFVTGYAAKAEPTVGYNAYNSYENKQPTQDGTNTVNYTNPESRVASSTGNYTGVYDMSGGCWEYVMGVIKGTNNSGFTFGSSGFSSSTFPFNDVNGNSKYYDIYDYSTTDSIYNRRILGDATGEMGPFGQKTYNSQTRKLTSWYDDEAWFAYSAYPWFHRGAPFRDGTSSGVFTFSRYTGGVDVSGGFRVVLAV